MAPRGRPPKPTSRHEAEGTLRKDRHADRRPAETVPDLVDAPEDFDAEQVEVFDAIVARLGAVGIVVKLSDAFAVERAAIALVTARRARKVLVEQGRYHEGQRGLTMHPAARDEKAAWEAFASAASTLGLSPLDRERIKANESPEQDAIDELAAEHAALLRADAEQFAAEEAAKAAPRAAANAKKPAAKKPAARKTPPKARAKSKPKRPK